MASIKRERIYPYRVEQVWRAISTREALSEWLMETDFEPVVGKQFTFRTDRAPGFDGVVRGEVLEVEPPHKLVYSWSGGPLQDTRIRFELTPVSNGTRLTFEHSGFSGLQTIVPRFVLTFGWRDLINKQIARWLAETYASPTAQSNQA